ncbi:hypothetical protein SS50377_25090 [Spironucleus salmonicida]|uniref:Uncharacterized protein n=1 Tax=Spironucleus salmonicida TaxID=348837 RepID=V6LEL6_9EUKA|nr:hypothetical protein SS50377_25090 [Spironucleus salmonicida]|eukprot:EST42960.1 hypothetical protein SS50377_17409 [Spironucleus salmonicida]
MYSVDLGNYFTKVHRRTTQSTEPIADQTGQRLIPTSIRFAESRNFAFQSSKSSTDFLFTAQTPPDFNNIYAFHCYLKKQLKLDQSVICTVPDYATIKLKLLYKSSLTPLYNFVQLIPASAAALSAFYFTYFGQLKTPLKAQILNVSETFSSNTVFEMQNGAISVLKHRISAISAKNFDQILAEISQIRSDKNIFEIKKTRKMLCVNSRGVLNAVERDCVVDQATYLNAGSGLVNQLFAELQCENVLVECVGGGSRDILIQNYLQKGNFNVKKRLNADECFAHGALLYSGMVASGTLKIDFMAQNTVEIRLSSGGKDYSNVVVIEQNVTRLPAAFEISLQIQSKSHVQILSQNFIIRVYEYLGHSGRQNNVKVACDINGEVEIKSDKFNEIFSYQEPGFIEGLVEFERQAVEKDKQSGME